MANEVVKQQTLQQLMNSGAVVKKMNDVLGSEKKASSFISSVISVSQNNKLLRNAEPMSILSSAMVAATLDLPVVPTLGMAYLVPYKGVCSFQIGYKGILELAMRSGEFRNIIDEVVYDGQLVKKNKFTGEYVFDEDSIKLDDKGQAKPIGVMARFDLINGYSKTIYWSLEEIEAHAKRFSQAYRSGYDSPWKSDFWQMAKKTVLKSLLNKYAPKSVAMQTALKFDQSKVNLNSNDIGELNVDAFDAEYVDNPEEVVDEQKAAEVADKFADFDGGESGNNKEGGDK
jgi:recombination protein RecT